MAPDSCPGQCLLFASPGPLLLSAQETNRHEPHQWVPLPSAYAKVWPTGRRLGEGEE